MIVIKDLSVATKRGKTVLDDISVTFGDGNVHAIVGPNGSGKTTLLRAVCHLIQISAGTIHIDGLDASTLSNLERASRLSWTESEHISPFAYKSEDIMIWGRWPFHRGNPTSIDHSRCRETAERMEICNLLDRPITNLSLGERKKVHLAKSLASDVQYLIWDEPCAPLDIRASLDILNIARDYAHRGHSIIFSIHDLSVVERYADTVTILKEGRLQWHGTPTAPDYLSQLESTFNVKIRRDGKSLRYDRPVD